MPHLRRDSFTLLRELMRWRVAMVLSVLIFVLMIVLGVINTRLGLADTAQLAWISLAVAGGCIAALLVLPKHHGGTVFFVSIAALLVGVMVFGLHHDRPMQHWAYIFPPVLVFLVSSRAALAGMIAFGIYASAMLAPLARVNAEDRELASLKADAERLLLNDYAGLDTDWEQVGRHEQWAERFAEAVTLMAGDPAAAG